MRNRMGVVRIATALCLLACVAAGAFGQVDAELTAKKRLFPDIGPGLRAVHIDANGKYYILASPSPGLVVYSKDGKKLLAMRESSGISKEAQEEAGNSGEVPIVFGEDMDVDTDGNIYIADSGANAVKVYSSTGRHLRTMPVPSPISLAVLPEGEVAVTTMRQPQLVMVLNKEGHDARDFGEPEPISDRDDLNRFLNIGMLESDTRGHLYYGFSYFPEPTVRQFDRFGYGAEDVQYHAIDALGEGQAVRREIKRQEEKGKAPAFKRVLTAVGVDNQTGEIWMALDDTLLHFDKDGNRRATYLIYTPSGARLMANTIVVEHDRLIVGGDPIGIYEFERQDNK